VLLPVASATGRHTQTACSHVSPHSLLFPFRMAATVRLTRLWEGVYRERPCGVSQRCVALWRVVQLARVLL
jgi:hypothetical protein